MPKIRKKELVNQTYFRWLIYQRKRAWYDDGRSNQPSAGRHSLGTADRNEALTRLKMLDREQAVANGLADAKIIATTETKALLLDDGWKLYEMHFTRPRVLGGVKPVSTKRYNAVFDKFKIYAIKEGVLTWNRVNENLLNGYAEWLVKKTYAYQTQYLEITTLKQAINWLAKEGHLENAKPINLSLSKATGTSAYCWTPLEVQAMVAHCLETSGLQWLYNVLVALASTGLRISELAALRWSDIDFVTNLIQIIDESTRARRAAKHAPRETKNSRSRSFPMSRELRVMLAGIARTSSGLIFQGPRGGRIKPDTVRNIFVREVLRPLGKHFPSTAEETGFKDGRLHSFRHYFCSACANANVPEAIVMKWLGHQDSRMVRHYYHLHDAETQRRMRGLSFTGTTGDASSPETCGPEVAEAATNGRIREPGGI